MALGRCTGILTAVVIASALPASSEASTLDFRLSSQTPGTAATLTLHIRYTKSGADANAKPSPIRTFQLDAPAGTAFHTAKITPCDATDAEAMATGTAACSSESRIGGGFVTVVTGFGAPFDPFVSPTPVFNDGKGWLEISQTDSDPAVTIAVTRLAVQGSRVSGPIGAAPGGPPDFETAVRGVDLSFPASTGYVTTPPSCPASGKWVATGTFGFADGTTHVVSGETPCTSEPEKPRGRPAIRASVEPHRIRAGRRVELRVALRSSDARCIAGAAVRMPGHPRIRTGGGGRVTIVKTFHRTGRRTLTATKAGCKSGRAGLTVLPGSGRDGPDS